jgi:negative regulator of flagellin synthesis FlgM
MKVHDASQIKALQPGPTADAPPAPKERRAPDRVSTEGSAKVAAAVAAASQGAGTARAARLRAIEAAVQNGTYKPDPQRIAQQILDEAEIAARLQALLGR